MRCPSPILLAQLTQMAVLRSKRYTSRSARGTNRTRGESRMRNTKRATLRSSTTQAGNFRPSFHTALPEVASGTAYALVAEQAECAQQLAELRRTSVIQSCEG